jgi:hypothetical protein
VNEAGAWVHAPPRHAMDQLKVTINRAVVGRPVKFRNSMRAKGNEQAMEIGHYLLNIIARCTPG